jgi:hypothetical protein
MTFMGPPQWGHHILVDGNAESQGDLLGDAGTTPVAITPFQFNDCVDEFFIRSFGPGARLRLSENSMRYFRLAST